MENEWPVKYIVEDDIYNYYNNFQIPIRYVTYNDEKGTNSVTVVFVSIPGNEVKNAIIDKKIQISQYNELKITDIREEVQNMVVYNYETGMKFD